MSRIIGIVGPSGSGKTTSLRNINHSKTFFINVSKKDPPFKGWKSVYSPFGNDSLDGNIYNEDSAHKIVTAMKYVDQKREDIDIIVVDDCQYIMAAEFMNRAKESGWQKFTDIGKNMWDVINTARNLKRDLTVIFTFHDEEITEGYVKRSKIKTIGKMVDEKVTLEGLFTIVLFTSVRIDPQTKEPEFLFQTKTDGTNTCKTPMGMFDKMYVANDMVKVLESINSYYN